MESKLGLGVLYVWDVFTPPHMRHAVHEQQDPHPIFVLKVIRKPRAVLMHELLAQSRPLSPVVRVHNRQQKIP
jgi:hypothetical protein